ncbi:LacI family DNA-binding transcriptional regulator [Sporomusa malonica]|uniref:LacI family DNA-binding transcriptional regulator n=1 Tax=Sporomusa malonica TaxID=112901 RepID=UPI002481B49C|nr:substrate-binding domain-containing protein [Sporomusa malonica]
MLVYTFDSGYKAAIALIDSQQSFDAIFAANDMMAIGAIEALTERGLKIPEDVAVVGYDDIRMAGWYKPALTTVRQPVYDMGLAAVEILLKQITGAKTSVCEQKFMPELIVRKSSGAKEG